MKRGFIFKLFLITATFNISHASSLWGNDTLKTNQSSKSDNLLHTAKTSSTSATEDLNSNQRIKKDLNIKIKKYDIESKYQGLVQENENKQIATTTLSRRPTRAEQISGVYFSIGATQASHDYFMYTGTGSDITTTKNAKENESSSKISPSVGFGYRFLTDGVVGLYAAIEAEYMNLDSQRTSGIDNSAGGGSTYSYKDEMEKYHGINTKIGINIKQVVALYAIAGMGNVSYNTMQTVTPTPSSGSLDFDQDISSSATVLGFGAEIFITPEASVFVQFTELQSSQKLDYTGGAGANEAWKDDLDLQMIKFGVNIKLF